MRALWCELFLHSAAAAAAATICSVFRMNDFIISTRSILCAYCCHAIKRTEVSFHFIQTHTHESKKRFSTKRWLVALTRHIHLSSGFWLKFHNWSIHTHIFITFNVIICGGIYNPGDIEIYQFSTKQYQIIFSLPSNYMLLDYVVCTRAECNRASARERERETRTKPN